MQQWLIAVAWTATCIASATGQTPSTASFDSAGGAAGLGFLRPQEWGLVRCRIRNDGATAAQLLSAVQFKDGENIQFVTDAWVPPWSVREVLQPVYLHVTPRDDRAVELMSLLIDTARGEQMRGREDGLIRLDTGDHVTAMTVDSDADDAISAVVAARIASGGSMRVAYVRSSQLPAMTAVYDSVSCLVLADRELALTPAQAQAIRAWVSGGGRLWLMLDRLPPEVGPRLLGNDWPIAVVDRLLVTQLTIEGPSGPLQREREEPWTLLRVISADARVLHRVEGWPASMAFPVGSGTVVVTTLDAAAWWLDPDREGGSPRATDPLSEVATLAVGGAAVTVPIDARRFESFVREQVGYTILGRSPVIAVLALLPAAVVLSGLWLARRQRLERVGMVGVCVAVLLCTVLIGMGSVQRRRVPLTVASAQWVEVAPRQGLAHVQAAISIYSPEAGRGPLRGSRGGILWPDMTGQGGKQLRMVWTDLDHWSWEGLELPSGAVRTAGASNVLQLSARAQVALTFGPQGVEGHIAPGPFERLEDLVLATPVAAMAVRTDADGRFTVRPGDELRRGEYIAGATLGQQQRSRQEIYRGLLDDGSYPARPTLLSWAKSLDLGLELSIPATQHHSALVAMPVTVTPRAAAGRMAVPGAFVPFTLVRGPGNEGTTTLFDATRRTWIGPVPQGHTLLFRFQLPPQVLPLRLESATLTVELSAADRRVEILRLAHGRIEQVATLEHGAGTQRVPLHVDQLGTLDADGGIIIGVRVGDADESAFASVWQIHDARLDVVGDVDSLQ